MQLLRPDLHTLTGAHVLDALDDPAEQHRFARHLRRCQACTAEVRGLREVATSLALAVAAEPPPAMRERVMAAVRRTRQLPPEVDRHAYSRPPRRILVVATVAAVAIVIAGVLGIRLYRTQRELSAAQARTQAISAVLYAPDARILSARTSSGGRATVVVSAARRELTVAVAGLRALPDGEVYQLWLIGPPRTRSAGLLPAPVSGRAGPVLATGLASGDRLGITIEPAGGTRQPTTTPLIALPLP
jgi:anti-sigma-K factor RskA